MGEHSAQNPSPAAVSAAAAFLNHPRNSAAVAAAWEGDAGVGGRTSGAGGSVPVQATASPLAVRQAAAYGGNGHSRSQPQLVLIPAGAAHMHGLGAGSSSTCSSSSQVRKPSYRAWVARVTANSGGAPRSSTSSLAGCRARPW